MTVAFTICSNNYLAHAKTLGDSFLQYHPEAKFVIGLVDKISEEFDFSFFDAFEIIPVETLQMNGFDELQKKFNITELNTAVKPSYLTYIFTELKANKVIYIDPDILVLTRLEEVLNILDEKNIIVTPHICSPIEDEFAPTDYHTLRGGIFNLGFIGLSNYETVKGFIEWWHDRVVKYGFVNFSLNMFYDQIWANYIPCFYDNYFILKHLGYNMANWNLHERALSTNKDGAIYVNEKFPLRFFHFSSYHFDKPDIICRYLTRYNFINRPDLIEIFEIYRGLLIKNKVEIIKKLPVYYYPNINGIKTEQKKDPFKFIKRIQQRVLLTTKVFINGHT